MRGSGQAAREGVIPAPHTYLPSALSLRPLSMAECVAATETQAGLSGVCDRFREVEEGLGTPIMGLSVAQTCPSRPWCPPP